MQHRIGSRILLSALSALGLGLGLGIGLGPGSPMSPSPAQAQSPAAIDPGQLRAELGDFRRLVGAVAFAADDVWAAGDGIVHFDGAGWKQVISGQRPFFRAIDGSAPDQIWAAGELAADYCDSYGLLYHFDGQSWQPQATGTHVPLYGLDMLSATDGWAVGGMEQAVIVRYDGRAWHTVAAPELAGLRAVQALAADDVWAVGDRGAIAHYDGQGWEVIEGPGFAYLTDLHLLHAGFGWAVGIDRDNSGSAVVLAFRDGRWTLDSFDEMPALYAVRSLAEDWTLAVGRNGVLMHHDGTLWREVGRTNPGGYNPWGFGPSPAGEPGDPEAPPGGVAADETVDQQASTAATAATADVASAPDGDAPPRLRWDERTLNSLVLMPDKETLLAVGFAGQIVSVRDDLSWRELHTGHVLGAIDMLNPDFGWVVGTGGRPLRWDGQTWTAPPAPSSARWLSDVEVVAPNDAWAIGRRGTVLHWDGAAWTQTPRFTWLDLVAVAFNGPADGWAVAVANGEDAGGAPWDWTAESIVFRWDGTAWRQAIRLCHAWITDLAVQGPGRVWFAAGGRGQVLLWDGAGFSWQPVWGYDSPSGPGTGISWFGGGADGALWGNTYFGGFARLENGIWRSHRLAGSMDEETYIGRIAGGDRDGFWTLTNSVLQHVDADGKMQPVLTLPNSMNGMDIVTDAAGVAEVFLIGEASTVLHYRAPSARQLAPLATATAALPPPLLHPTPTPFSVYDRDAVVERLTALVDPDDTGEAQIDQLRLMSLASWWRTVDVDYLDIPEDEDEDWPWFWEDHGSLDPCDRGADLPVWVAEFSAGPRCPSHLLAVLDGSGRDAWQLVCYPRRVATVYLPLALRPKEAPDAALTPSPTPTLRSLTPEPVTDIHGACPTVTPRPEDPEEP